MIICGKSDTPMPVFTLMERLFTKWMIITETQKGFLQKVCETFPVLEGVEYVAEKCLPSPKCVSLKCA